MRDCLRFVPLFVLSSLAAAPLGYLQTNLVTDATDPDLKNPWGVSFTLTSPFWVSDSGTGLSTLYSGSGTKAGLIVSIVAPPGSPAGTISHPTGTVANSTADFGGDRFLFATAGGTINGWQPSSGTIAITRADSSASGSVYTGLAIAGSQLYAANFALGKIDIFDSNYNAITLAGNFTDPNLPAGYSPYNVQNFGGNLYVTFVKQTPGGAVEAGAGNGFVDIFAANGILIQRLVSGAPGNPASPINAPWGLALAPAGFGPLSNLLLIGNSGDGRINGYDPVTGTFVTGMADQNGDPLQIDGLHALSFGNNGTGFDPGKLYFTAGPNGGTNGLFGSLEALDAGAAAPEPGSLSLSVLAGLTLAFRLRRP